MIQKFDKLLQDEQVRQLLLDSDVVKLMKMLREEPDKAQWYEIERFQNYTVNDNNFPLLDENYQKK